MLEFALYRTISQIETYHPREVEISSWRSALEHDATRKGLINPRDRFYRIHRESLPTGYPQYGIEDLIAFHDHQHHLEIWKFGRGPRLITRKRTESHPPDKS